MNITSSSEYLNNVHAKSNSEITCLAGHNKTFLICIFSLTCSSESKDNSESESKDNSKSGG